MPGRVAAETGGAWKSFGKGNPLCFFFFKKMVLILFEAFFVCFFFFFKPNFLRKTNYLPVDKDIFEKAAPAKKITP